VKEIQETSRQIAATGMHQARLLRKAVRRPMDRGRRRRDGCDGFGQSILQHQMETKKVEDSFNL
jgi:hypothetical protein